MRNGRESRHGRHRKHSSTNVIRNNIHDVDEDKGNNSYAFGEEFETNAPGSASGTISSIPDDAIGWFESTNSHGNCHRHYHNCYNYGRKNRMNDYGSTSTHKSKHKFWLRGVVSQ
ncbi:unnamed protein product [Pseudo-nitzschia multistriata]|uniref:Uncharacterized protein n=1 Tax=Pseudo-nitzschia multistriata TaxID=183589 RepID=A0A448Z318_9STRA|nr:unnamed protein product [Pseudo-nitzschia multistriata]